MTNNQWHQLVQFVQAELSKAPEYRIQKEIFYSQFDLSDSDDLDFLEKRDNPRDKFFEFRTEHIHGTTFLIFSCINSQE